MALSENSPKTRCLMELVVEASNLREALKRVVANKGSPGVDGMTVNELASHLRQHWPDLKKQLLEGRYEPKPVKRVEIPKPGGGVRQLGVPTVVDRFIQQAVLQVMTPIYDPGFSAQSYGFRPGRNAEQAVAAAREYIAEGHGWVVDMDLEKFFDRVNHDVLMARVAKTIEDKRLLKLLRRYLQAGVMADGVVVGRDEGTPQGGPLSPLLSNILLDALDKELEARGHKFVRYADDCNIYVKSRKSGERVFGSIKLWLGRKLRLKVNEAKSAVAKPEERKFLGFGFWWDREGRVGLKIAEESLKRVKAVIRKATGRNRGCAMEEVIRELNRRLGGWVVYYRSVNDWWPLKSLDGWIRRRLRCFKLKQWKNNGWTRVREMRKLGVSPWNARSGWCGNRWWMIAGGPAMQQAMSNAYLAKQGLQSLLERYRQLQTFRTAGCGPACPVVWEGRGGG